MERQWLQMWHPRLTHGCQYPPRLQILRIDREGRIDDVITHVTWRHLCKNILVDSNCHKFAMTQNVRKRCCWHCYIWADSFTFTLLLPSHAGVYEETFNVNIKIAQTMQNIWNLACQQRSYSQGIWNVIVRKSGLLRKCMGGHYH